MNARSIESLPGKVWFVGAGPGAADLLTVRATRLLAQAGLVLHDALLTAAVLDWAPQALHWPVGKRCEGASVEQAWIDRALVEAAQRHAVVVRLKGGDPTVFGRLDEEIAALDAAGIDWEIVPGVTAASSAAAAAGHSLTRRGVARRVDVVTPRVARDEEARQEEGGRADWAEGLSPSGTVVLYMAGRIADRCARVLLSKGFPADTPVLCVRAASWPDQSVERMVLSELALCGIAVDTRPMVLLVGAALAERPDALTTLLSRPPQAAAHPEGLQTVSL